MRLRIYLGLGDWGGTVVNEQILGLRRWGAGMENCTRFLLPTVDWESLGLSSTLFLLCGLGSNTGSNTLQFRQNRIYEGRILLY